MMVLSDAGLNRITALTVADIDDGRAGTGTTLPTASDTNLETPVVATEADVDVTQSGSTFAVTHIVVSTAANGSDLTEWQIRMNAEATQLNRVVTAAVSKTAELEVTKITLFTVLGE